MRKLLSHMVITVTLVLVLASVIAAQQKFGTSLTREFGIDLPQTQTQTSAIDANAASVNVMSFGAKGNGRTDDTQAIRNAINSIAKAGGGKLVFPNGSYAVSSSIDLPSGITIEGTNGTYNGNCQIRLTVPNQQIFTIGQDRRRITIREIELKAAPQSVTPYKIMQGTIAIAATGSAPKSSFEFLFSNLTITGFDRGISVEGAGNRGEWQFDNVLVEHCTFAENNYGIYVNSQNAAYWKIHNCYFGTMPNGYGIYLARSGFFTIDSCSGGGPPQARARGIATGGSYIYVGGAHGNLTIINSETEELENFLEVTEPHNYSNPITVIDSIIGQKVLLRANCIYISIGNLYHGKVVETVGNANDVLIHSFGDVVESPPNSGLTPPGASAFKLIGNSRVVFGSSTYRVDIGNPTTFSWHVGVGADPAKDALLNLVTPNDNEVQMRLGNTAGWYYDLLRDTSGYLIFRGNQTGFIGYRFNGDIVPAQNGTGNLGTDASRWDSVHAVKVVSGDAILADKETGEELYRMREDKNNIYFDDIRTGKQLMRLDRDGNLHVTGKVYQDSK